MKKAFIAIIITVAFISALFILAPTASAQCDPPCENDGVCIAVDTCDCTATGYTGTFCETPICDGIPATDPNVCSGRGTCIAPDTCACTGATGQFCETPLCNNIPADDPSVCSGRGICTDTDTCSCINSIGQWCETPIPTCDGILATDPTVCSGRGTCIAPDTCACTGATGQFCETPLCNNIPADDPSVCSGRGVCTAPDTCSCTDAIGQWCETPNPATVAHYITATGTYSFAGQVNAIVNCTDYIASGTITITVHPGEFHPESGNDSVQRWFGITSTASGTFTLTLSYLESELNGEDKGKLCFWRYSGGTWDGPYIGSVDVGANTVTVIGISEFSDWVIRDNQSQSPVPEIVTIALVCLGLALIVGYRWYISRQGVVATA